ncbi:BtrH N-terminal domain-containing protein [Paenibacillus kobensis]|uniref:BtrH N-terminal domain-containing protein n=1 Tax=Paenibacillus kobensis TaxID=59841 RepID=UPI0013E3A616|nr:BtrH N-terminal domain-containing protein [Paenibacillus kobensis]
MKVLDVEPVKSAGGDCFDDVIVTLDGWYRRGYQLMYANALKFEWAPPSPGATFGSRMQTGVADTMTLLGQFHGFDTRVIRNLSPQEGLDLIREQLNKGNPICLNFDTFYCPWDLHFGKFHHFMHVMIAVGIDPATEELLIVDPFFSKKDLRISMELYEGGLLGIMTVEPSPGWTFDRERLLNRLRFLLQEHLDQSPGHFHRFADEIGDIDFELEAEEGSSRFIASPLFIMLNVLSTARINYASMLEYVADTFDVPSIASCSEEVRRLSNAWSTVRGMLAKLNFMPPERRDAKMMASLGVKIRNAVETEIGVLLRVLACLDGESQFSNAQVAASSLNEQSTRFVTSVDISSLCNIRGIDNGRGTADVDDDGHCYGRDDVPEDRLLQIEKMSFLFPASKDDTECDNFACYGQSIAIPKDRYNGLMVLASSQYGGSEDMFTIEYEDGTSEQVKLGFADWWSPFPIAGEKIALSATLIRNTVGPTDNTVYLFANEASLTRTESPAVRLIMPTMPNLHVFAVSLWKEA